MTSEKPKRQARKAKVRLDDLLVTRGLAETRSQAQRLILGGQVWVGDRLGEKAGQQLTDDAPLRLQEGIRYVGRGGLKLEAALDAFEVDPSGWTCADIGASTGGFTDCLLQRGAARVYAVDVGYGQLAWSVRSDARVVPIDRTNIRYLESLPEPVSLATIDVSFIGLALVLPAVKRLLAPAGQIIALIKPQFEAGKGQVGKGGVVREVAIHRSVLSTVLQSAAALDLAASGLILSPITGPAGNREFLVCLRLGDPPPQADKIAAWIAFVTLE